jgi:hypothetical protein
VSQPSDRGAEVPLPGELDDSLHEFWVSNPWQIVAAGNNLSAYERNRAFLNVKGEGFLDISHLTGADSDGDGRAVVAADFRNVGMLDLLVRQAGGGTLLLYENRFPRKHFLEVSLRGTKSNRQGVGARLTLETNGMMQVREMYPVCSFRSQGPNVVHFGLGDSGKVDRLTIRWPSGRAQELHNLRADRHVVVTEDRDGDEAVTTVEPGKTIHP